MRRTIHFVLVLFIPIILITYQNCAKMQFATDSDLASKTVLSYINSTDQQMACTNSNSLKITMIVPFEAKTYCQDQSALDTKYSLGLTCKEGVEIKSIQIDSSVVPCEEVTICGVKGQILENDSYKISGKKIVIEYVNLPWGCNVNVVSIKNVEEKNDANNENNQAESQKTTEELIYTTITPPACPLCSTTNEQSCELCAGPVICSFGGMTYQIGDLRKEACPTGLNGFISYQCKNDGSWGLISKECNSTNCTFNEQTLASGQSITAYAASSVAYGQSCQSQTRTCNNGTLSGTYAFNSCTVGGANACTFNGASIINGQSVTAYATNSVPFGQTCQSQTRTCSNGALSGTYTFRSCFVAPISPCSFNGATIESGQTVTAYAASSVLFGQTCQSQTRACYNGTLSGSYGFNSCTVQPPASCGGHGSGSSWSENGGNYVKREVADTRSWGGYSMEFLRKRNCRTVTNYSCYNGSTSQTGSYESCDDPYRDDVRDGHLSAWDTCMYNSGFGGFYMDIFRTVCCQNTTNVLNSLP